MPQNLIIKKLSRHNVQQKRILNLDCSLPLLHRCKQATGLTVQNLLQKFPRQNKELKFWKWWNGKTQVLWEYQREFIWAFPWDKIRALRFDVTICIYVFQSTTISIRMSSQNKADSPHQKYRGYFSINSMKDNTDEYHVLLQNFWLHQTCIS